jgi:hypothetical protein
MLKGYPRLGDEHYEAAAKDSQTFRIRTRTG